MASGHLSTLSQPTEEQIFLLPSPDFSPNCFLRLGSLSGSMEGNEGLTRMHNEDVRSHFTSRLDLPQRSFLVAFSSASFSCLVPKSQNGNGKNAEIKAAVSKPTAYITTASTSTSCTSCWVRVHVDASLFLSSCSCSPPSCPSLPKPRSICWSSPSRWTSLQVGHASA